MSFSEKCKKCGQVLSFEDIQHNGCMSCEDNERVDKLEDLKMSEKELEEPGSIRKFFPWMFWSSKDDNGEEREENE